MGILGSLCTEFFLTGLFAVGGGLATIPFLQDMGRRHPGWFSAAQLADMIAASQCSPGPLGMNMATYVGYSVAGRGARFSPQGLLGSAMSVLALMTPTVVIDLLVSLLLERFQNAAWIARIMTMLRPASAGLLCAAAFVLLQISLTTGKPWMGAARLADFFDWRCCLLYAALVPLVFWKKLQKLHPLLFLGFGAAVGLVFRL